jgi:hypothetical protein
MQDYTTDINYPTNIKSDPSQKRELRLAKLRQFALLYVPSAILAIAFFLKLASWMVDICITMSSVYLFQYGSWLWHFPTVVTTLFVAAVVIVSTLYVKEPPSWLTIANVLSFGMTLICLAAEIICFIRDIMTWVDCGPQPWSTPGSPVAPTLGFTDNRAVCGTTHKILTIFVFNWLQLLLSLIALTCLWTLITRWRTLSNIMARLRMFYTSVKDQGLAKAVQNTFGNVAIGDPFPHLTHNHFMNTLGNVEQKNYEL